VIFEEFKAPATRASSTADLRAQGLPAVDSTPPHRKDELLPADEFRGRAQLRRVLSGLDRIRPSTC